MYLSINLNFAYVLDCEVESIVCPCPIPRMYFDHVGTSET